jgi:Skp family chaperone for outer membrane proteins
MKVTKSFIITVAILALSMNHPVMARGSAAKSASFNVAVVNVQKLIESSPKINALNLDRKNKLDDLAKFVENARNDVAKEKDATKQKALEDSYNKELNTRKDALDKDYAKKMSDIDKEVTALIKSKAKELGYDLTLAKTGVLDGGDDITSSIVKELK